MKKPIAWRTAPKSRYSFFTFEYQKRITYLAIGTLVLDFMVLIDKIDPVLTNLQSVTLALSALTMALATICGILGWQAFERRMSILSDESMDLPEPAGQDSISLSDYWYSRQLLFEMWLKYLFGMGFAFTIAFMFARLFPL